MGEYEPEDSRTVTQSTHQAPGEPPRTGPREDQARRQARQDQGEDRAAGEAQMEQDINTAALEHGQPVGHSPASQGERGEQAPDPERLRRDAERPLGGS